MITLDLTPDENQLNLFDPPAENYYPEDTPLAEQYDGGSDYEDNLSDVEADAMTLASAGMGTDEDYVYGNDDGY